MDELIRIISDLQSIYRKIGVGKNFDLPQIVVVGAQSSGKSSTLEALVGKEFLPRGEGIVTRRPLQLELIHVSPEQTHDDGSAEWAIFPGEPPVFPKTFTNFSQVCTEIERQTETKAEGKNICQEPITLKVFSPNVSTLTLIDLPGLTEVPVMNQPADIADQIEKLVMSYVTKPKSIILAVHPANIDAANCVALKVAKKADPSGDRTIAVITMLDKAGEKDIIPLLTGKLFDQNLLGIIGVYNRTGVDRSEFGISQAKKREQDFLRKTFPPDIAAVQGVEYLARRLGKILISHILQFLPEIKNDVDNEILVQQYERDSLGEPIKVDENEAGPRLTEILDRYTKKLADLIDGIFDHKPPDDRIVGGAKIKEIFSDDFVREIKAVGEVVLDNEQVKIVMKNASGVTANIFSPDPAFQMLVRQFIGWLLDPSLKIVEQVHTELTRIAETSWQKSMRQSARFPRLRSAVFSGTSEFLRQSLDNTKKQVESLLNKEMSYINTNHPKILDYMKKHENPAAGQQPGPNMEGYGETTLVNPLVQARQFSDPGFLIFMVKAYFYDVVVTNVLDMVPKTIMLSMVYHTTGPKGYAVLAEGSGHPPQNLFQYLNYLLQPNAASLLTEAEDITIRRQKAEEAIEDLKEKSRHLDSISAA